MKFRILILIVLFHTIALGQSQTQRVLFLGNSYTYVNNLPQLIADAATSSGDTLIFDSHTPGGYTLNQHYFDTVSTNKIQAGGWNYVVLQDQSQVPAFPDYDGAGGVALAYLNKRFNPCARTLFYMTWGRKSGDAFNCAVFPPVCTYNGMDSLLHLSYMQMALASHSEVSPVGAAWKYIRQNNPAIELYQPDESHPSAAGSYLAACCFYASIFKKDPTLISYNYSLNSTDAAILRNAAKIIVKDSLSNWFFPNSLPIANFHYTIGTGTNEINMINNSLNASDYFWDFGDGITSTLKNATHNYLSNGTYTVSLTASSCDLSVVHQATNQKTITFCTFNPTVSPGSILVCPNSRDTLWTQNYDSYQWFDTNGDSVLNQTNQYLLPPDQGFYSVLASLNGCSEMSPQAVVYTYHSLQFFYITEEGNILADTACQGDTLMLILSPNKPPYPSDKNIQWFKNNLPILSSNNDTLFITSEGDYQVSYYDSTFCPGNLIYQSPSMTLTFIPCDSGNNGQPMSVVYPNPSETFILKINPLLLGASYTLTDLTGRIIGEGKLEMEITNLQMNNASNGIYFLQIQTNLYRHIHKLIKSTN